ncbi:glutaredoxin family protein [Mesorhizobium sp. CC13]|uniref:glutaredoxin family protein n=1 Tax=Mesorhizobium sp. CC13 TaxID=3029194 RepID=UPI003267A139
MMRPPWIEIFTTPDCPDCAALKRWLNAEYLPFVERDMSDPAVAEEVRQRTGMRVAPITVIDGTQVFFGTFDEQRWRIEAIHTDQAETETQCVARHSSAPWPV